MQVGSGQKRIPLEGSTEGTGKQRPLTERRGGGQTRMAKCPAPCHHGELLPAQVLKQGGNLSWKGEGPLGRSHGPGGTEPLPERKAKAGPEHWEKYPSPSLLHPSAPASSSPWPSLARRESEGQGARGGGYGEGNAQNRRRKVENRSGWGVAPFHR